MDVHNEFQCIKDLSFELSQFRMDPSSKDSGAGLFFFFFLVVTRVVVVRA